jgi:hypothetical protein
MQFFTDIIAHVGMERFILAQVLGLGTLIFNFWSYQTTDQRKYFKRFTIGSGFWFLMFLAIGAQLPVMLVSSVSVIRGIVFYWALSEDTPFRRMVARRTMYTTLIVAVVAAVPTIMTVAPATIPIQVFLLIGVFAFVIGQYMPGVYLVRIGAVVYALSLILSNSPLDTFNPMGIIIELNNLLAVAVFFVGFYKANKEKARLAAIRPAALSLGRDLRLTNGITETVAA